MIIVCSTTAATRVLVTGYRDTCHVTLVTVTIMCHKPDTETLHIRSLIPPSPAKPSPAVDGNDTNNIEAHACRRLIFILETSMKECEVILTFPTFEQ